MKFNGVSAGTASSWKDAEIKIKVPSGSTTGPVIVTTGGGASNAYSLTVKPAPNPCGVGTAGAVMLAGMMYIALGFRKEKKEKKRKQFLSR